MITTINQSRKHTPNIIIRVAIIILFYLWPGDCELTGSALSGADIVEFRGTYRKCDNQIRRKKQVSERWAGWQ